MRKRDHTLIDGVYYSSDKSKAEYVYDKEYGIGYGFVYSVEYGKRAVKVGADIEHIEFVRHAAFKEITVHDFVEDHRDAYEARENYHCPREKSFVESVSVTRNEEYTENYLKSVMDHRLYIDTDGFRVYLFGVYHGNETAEEGERRHVSHYSASELAILHKYYKRNNEYGGRTELEGECIPQIVPYEGVASERVNELLVDLADYHKYPCREEDTAHVFFVSVLEADNEEYRKRYHYHKTAYVEETVHGRFFGSGLDSNEELFKCVHKRN